MERSPSDPGRRRFAGPQVLLVGLVIVLGISGFLIYRMWQGVRYDGDVPVAEAPSSATVEHLARTVYYSSEPEVAELKTQDQGIQLGSDMTAFQVEGESNRWVVHVTWYYLAGESLHLYSFAEMVAMEQEGRLTESTPVGFAVYRYVVEGTTPGEVAEAAQAKRPQGIPGGLLQKLREELTAAADSMNAH
jgi:hypothetical protein